MTIFGAVLTIFGAVLTIFGAVLTVIGAVPTIFRAVLTIFVARAISRETELCVQPFSPLKCHRWLEGKLLRSTCGYYRISVFLCVITSFVGRFYVHGVTRISYTIHRFNALKSIAKLIIR
jgi:hypothetical protein